MTAHFNLTEELRDLASIYALGTGETSETREFEQHLSACAVCEAEVRALREVTAQLAHEAPLIQPAPRVKRELLSRLSSEHRVVRAEEQLWEKTPFPGIEIRRLFVDKATGMVTTLLRAAAGAVYPAHRHGGLEQVYVIDGDLIFDDHTLETGDYEASREASEHSSITTKDGCLALIVHHVGDKFFRP
ncbi:MAG: cupin domain-containing protein [Acidobacteriia bacterium]|nr:cupin domain-containing protein [Terriglobia bacterium]MBV8901990.1 cupin domain-containing protein [Terriglobia bacterium]